MARPIALEESRHPLDHPIWNALTSVQSTVAEGDDRARRYPVAMAPFAATRDTSQESYAALRALVSGNNRIALFASRDSYERAVDGIARVRADGCTTCAVRNQCAGFFATGRTRYTQHIRAVAPHAIALG